MFNAFSPGEYQPVVNPIHIIGIGSPFGDDQLGWQIVDALEHSSSLPASWQSVSFIKADRPGINLLELMRDCDTVIIVDAMKSGAPAGTIRRFNDAEIEQNDIPLSSHGFGVAAALTLARALDQMPKTLVLYGIEADSTDHPESRKIDSAINDLTRKISAELVMLQL